MATNQPFTFLALRLDETPELKMLAEQGHRIIYASQLTCEGAALQIDKVIGPDCWRLMPDQMKWLPLALKEMRAAQPKPTRKKKVSNGTPTS